MSTHELDEEAYFPSLEPLGDPGGVNGGEKKVTKAAARRCSTLKKTTSAGLPRGAAHRKSVMCIVGQSMAKSPANSWSAAKKAMHLNTDRATRESTEEQQEWRASYERRTSETRRNETSMSSADMGGTKVYAAEENYEGLKGISYGSVARERYKQWRDQHQADQGGVAQGSGASILEGALATDGDGILPHNIGTAHGALRVKNSSCIMTSPTGFDSGKGMGEITATLNLLQASVADMNSTMLRLVQRLDGGAHVGAGEACSSAGVFAVPTRSDSTMQRVHTDLGTVHED